MKVNPNTMDKTNTANTATTTTTSTSQKSLETTEIPSNVDDVVGNDVVGDNEDNATTMSSEEKKTTEEIIKTVTKETKENSGSIQLLKSQEEIVKKIAQASGQEVKKIELKNCTSSQKRAIVSTIISISMHWPVKLIKDLCLSLEMDHVDDFVGLMKDQCDLDARLFLVNINEELRIPIIWEMLQLCVTQGKYDSRSRTALIKLCKLFHIPHKAFLQLENNLAILLMELHEQKQKQDMIEKDKNSSASRGRWWKIGLGAAIGGGIMLVTGGLAAPIVIPAFGALITTAGAIAGLTSVSAILVGALTTAGVPLITGMFGLTGAGLLGYKVSRLTGEVSEFKFDRLMSPSEKQAIQQRDSQNKHPSNHEQNKHPSKHEQNKMHVMIFISGVMKYQNEDISTWEKGLYLCNSQKLQGEYYALRWETAKQMNMANIIENFIIDKLTKEAVKFAAVTVSIAIAGALSAIAWPLTIAGASSIVDNPWFMLLDRAEKSGTILAKVLMKKIHGDRPVSLIGHSAGARVIFYCLEELARHNACGIIENVYLLGAPVTASVKRWKMARSVVSGRFVNGYCSQDWVLAFLYRTTKLTLNVAGLRPILIDAVDNQTEATTTSTNKSNISQTDLKIPSPPPGLELAEPETIVEQDSKNDENQLDRTEVSLESNPSVIPDTTNKTTLPSMSNTSSKVLDSHEKNTKLDHDDNDNNNDDNDEKLDKSSDDRYYEIPFIENIELSDIVSGYLDYRFKINEIMTKLKIEDCIDVMPEEI